MKNNPRRQRAPWRLRLPNLLWIGVLLGVFYWGVESVLHTYVFHSGSLRETLMGEHDPNEVWMRVLVTSLLAAFGWAAQRMVRSERHDKERALKLNRLFNYVHQITQRVGCRNQKQPTESANAPYIDDSIWMETISAESFRRCRVYPNTLTPESKNCTPSWN